MLKNINLNTTLKYPDFSWASRVKSGIWHMFCISKTRADRGKLLSFLESAGQIYPETGLTFEAPKCVLASVVSHEHPICVLGFERGSWCVMSRFLFELIMRAC
jgi:hypothetical protein